MFAQSARRSAALSARARGFTGAQSSRYQTLVKPLGLSARPQPQSLLARVTLRSSAPAPRASRVVYSTKNRSLSSTAATIENVAANRPIAWWMFGTAAVVGGMVAVGGATRLTRSGLSLVYWKPHGGLPPMTPEEWDEEFERYKQFPEYQQRKNMTVEDFKGIFWWEYGHRMLGRIVGLVYGVPLIYFAARKKLPVELHRRFGVLLGLGAAQGAIGWWMVRSGLEEHGKQQLEKRNEVRVSPYRLATHLAFAFTTLGMLLWTGFSLVSPPSRALLVRDMVSPDALTQAARARKALAHTSTVLGYTILSGAFVAGIDAGMAYNTFPKMDGQWIPDDLLALEPTYRNFFENVALVQLDHRLLALATVTGIGASYAMARRAPLWSQLPQQAKTALHLNLAAVGGQAALGITTLLTYVPIPLAVTHQCGAMVLMGSTLWTMHTLNFAKPSIARAARAAASKAL